MSDGNSTYEQFERQRELGRLQRAHHGATTALDDAEVRYNAISSWVAAMRFWYPMFFAVCWAWIGPVAGIDWLVGVGGLLMCFAIATTAGSMAAGVLGKLRKNIQTNTEHLWLMITGAILCMIGAGMMSIGVAATGAVVAMTPFIWTRWGRQKLAKTDYIRMRLAMASAASPRIIE